MKTLCIILALVLPNAAIAGNKLHRSGVGEYERHLEYKCIEAHPELNSDYTALRQCVKKMKGNSTFIFNKEEFKEKSGINRLK